MHLAMSNSVSNLTKNEPAVFFDICIQKYERASVHHFIGLSLSEYRYIKNKDRLNFSMPDVHFV